MSRFSLLRLACSLLTWVNHCHAADNLVADPSFEQPKDKDPSGWVFKHWAGWVYEGDCSFRVSDIARTGKHSLLIVGGSVAKIRAWPTELNLEPGRYRITAYIRGLDIGKGQWDATTEFAWEDEYVQLEKNGSFGWTPLTFVGDVKEGGKKNFPSFGLMAPGYLWVDDVSVEKVATDIPLTPKPVIGKEEQPIKPPTELHDKIVRCPECGYRNVADWKECYACGCSFHGCSTEVSESVKAITSFENDNPFKGAKVVADHVSDGAKALRIADGYAMMEAKQDWSGYDYLKADVHTDSKRPLELTIEIRDAASKGYWTRVNYTTVVPPGTSTLIIPTCLYVGEKSRPGRLLNRREITHLVFSIGESPGEALFLDNVRLERDTQSDAVRFDGLWAFDLGAPTSPLLEGFERLDVNKTYSKGRGFGWKNAGFWRTFDALQPEPLYQDFICVQSGGLALDVPNGRYRVFVNMDSPSGYWGEYQCYRRRALVLEGKRHVDTMDLARFKQEYFRFHDSEDLPMDNTFDKYQRALFNEKLHTVEVRDGQLNIDFEGENWACSVSAIVVFPLSKAAEGERFLEFTQQRRRFHFDNYFKRVLHEPTGNTGSNTSSNSDGRNMTVFARDPMRDVYYNDRPEDGERVEKLTASAFAGEYEPVTFSIVPHRDLGNVTVSAGELKSDDGATLPVSSIDIGYVRYRLSRLTYEGSVYTISPRFVVPHNNVQCLKGVTRRFWMTLRVPDKAKPSVYRGQLTIHAEHGKSHYIPIEVIVRKGSLDPVDLPVGPWGHTVDLPWFDDEAAEWNDALAMKSLQKLREYGFTTCTGLPILRYDGFKEGKPHLDFSVGDAQMKRLRQAGFTMPVVSYCPFHGLDLYYKDEAAMQQAGFDDYAKFIREIFTAVQNHADEANWLPVYWNIGDEPVDDDLRRSAENASAYHRAFPKGPPFFAAASSFTGSNKNDPHFQLSKSLHVANWNTHDEASVKLQHDAGGDWAFYNGGNRWTYGLYMFKAAKQFRMKWRLDWHWNMNAGHPYYALDCREDDFAWCSSTPDGDLIPTVAFERLREGLDDYRRLLTIVRLVRKYPHSAESKAARKRVADLLASFKLGNREVLPSRFRKLRRQLDDAVESLQ